MQSKYRIADIVETYDTRDHGTDFTANHLKTNYNLEDFKLGIFEFRGLALPTAGNACRDACRFLGCFEFDDSAGHDVGHFMVSIFKGGFIKRPTVTNLWQPKPTNVVSLKVSLQHFVEYFESEERMVRASRGSYEGAAERSQGTNLRPHDAPSLPQGCGLFTKMVHSPSGRCLSVSIFLDCHPGEVWSLELTRRRGILSSWRKKTWAMFLRSKNTRLR